MTPTTIQAAQRCRTLGLSPSFGFGDRIGLATPGHVAAMQRSGNGVQPIFAQQSIREMTRTGRRPESVIHDALAAMAEANWNGHTGADADHLKQRADVDATASAGFTFYTIDLSDHIDFQADNYRESELTELSREASQYGDWVTQYSGRTIALPAGTAFEIHRVDCQRAMVKYAKGVQFAIALADYIDQVCQDEGNDYEIELSVDETPQPTTLIEHYIIADQCLSHGMKLVSVAPRFIGDFEKGVDYRGDLDSLTRSLLDHAAVAEALGPYKLSLHSGSDKLSIYPLLARATKGRFHVKTAGTSYLEALRVVAQHEPANFREIVDFARRHYERDRATYHLSADLATLPAPQEIADDDELEAIYLGHWSDVPNGHGFTNQGRQVLHCTFGSVLTDPSLGGMLREVIKTYQSAYTELLADHFHRHLAALHSGMVC